MMKQSILKSCMLICMLGISVCILAQAKPLRNSEEFNRSPEKPFKILTSGKQITIQAKQQLKSVMVWTSGGNRIIEQKDINHTSFTFQITVRENIFFLMAEFTDGKRFTEKIGVK